MIPLSDLIVTQGDLRHLEQIDLMVKYRMAASGPVNIWKNTLAPRILHGCPR